MPLKIVTQKSVTSADRSPGATRLSGRCRADRDEACENCYSPHVSTLCPFSIEARAAAVETGVELVLTPTNGEALRWVLPRHARPPWRLPQHAPLV